ncbi:hypothetical protein O181_022914 [Austropuccinia psidii MF-1]|uniref:Uncharacterized protein n=1 Tax=Austropuccinia psidii MF-1 TaxID=1389203 RepID=A0A9Q3CFQ0_9BASI|nr:hypothetical protein [Austropuccinia psidii MF-1]
MWIPGFENLLNAQNTHNSQTDPEVISDIWHQFKSSPHSKKAFTNILGNLLFSLYVDWFNPFITKGAAKSISIGSIILTCLSLPPSERYKDKNMFWYAIILGPKDPSLDQMNSILEPLVIELQILWNVIWFFNTHDLPHSRLIRVDLLRLIADLPDIDIYEFQPRTHETHLSKANEWLQLQAKREQDDSVKSHGVCWSILNNLDYWKPIDFCCIDIMHCLILGNIKDYCISVLKVGLYGHELELQRKKKSFLADSNPFKYPFASLGCPQKRKNDDENDSQQMNRPKKQNLTKANLSHIWPCASQWNQFSSEAFRTKGDQTE